MDWGELFWRAKRLWPGDPQFSPDSFGELPSHYVLQAIKNGQELRRRELHEGEIGVANLTALTANINRDAKKNKTPYKASDFCFFASAGEKNDPDEINAAAYFGLIESKQLPPWALFVFSDMKRMKSSLPAPDPVAAIGDGFVLLAPQPVNGGMEGLLMAEQRVSGQVIEVKLGRMKLKVAVPEFEEMLLAREHVFVSVHG